MRVPKLIALLPLLAARDLPASTHALRAVGRSTLDRNDTTPVYAAPVRPESAGSRPPRLPQPAAASNGTGPSPVGARSPTTPAGSPSAAPAARDESEMAAWAAGLGPLNVRSATTGEVDRIRLYGEGGALDPAARARLEQLACAKGEEPHELSPRLEQLVVKAAYHFRGAHVVIVSGWRANAGKHGTGEALDFKLEGVRAAKLAAYLRGLPRVGVGIYTHPRTQFVHLDVREPSYFWLDASPPGVHWREARLRDAHADRRDAAWTPEMDRP